MQGRKRMSYPEGMKNSNIKKIAGLLAASLLLAACNGNGQQPSGNQGGLAGIDSDGNGIRDEVDAVIKQGAKTEAQRRWGAGYAKSLQRAITGAASMTEAQAVALSKELFFANSCLVYATDDLNLVTSIRNRSLDTAERKAAIEAFYAKVGDLSWTFPEIAECGI